jgi:death-on-curing protein
MNEPIWLTEALVVDIHSEQLAIFGGPSGIRDRGLLSSALARAPNKFVYGEHDLAALAAAYVFGISKNHPFIDGNKRASFAALIVFLGLNGVEFMVPETHATAMILEVAAGNVSEESLTRWLRDNWPLT